MFDLKLTQDQLRVISSALEKEPFKEVAQLINDINLQLKEQQELQKEG